MLRTFDDRSTHTLGQHPNPPADPLLEPIQGSRGETRDRITVRRGTLSFLSGGHTIPPLPLVDWAFGLSSRGVGTSTKTWEVGQNLVYGSHYRTFPWRTGETETEDIGPTEDRLPTHVYTHTSIRTFPNKDSCGGLGGWGTTNGVPSEDGDCEGEESKDRFCKTLQRIWEETNVRSIPF